MTSRSIIECRLVNQQLTNSRFTTAAQLVDWMGCIQSQDFAASKWAIGNRIDNITEAQIDKEFNEGKILRTHILRPTWHFVTPDDIAWMLKLTAPRIRAFSKSYLSKLNLDKKVLNRSKNIIAKALRDGNQLSRQQLMVLLKKAKVNTDDIRSTFIMMEAELDGLICSGGRQGKQFTYALLEERVPKIKRLNDEAPVAKLAKKYFTSHGPATKYDFAWWSGLTLAQAKEGIELNKKQLAYQVVEGNTYWFSCEQSIPKPKKSVFLLPMFDEYTVAYKDRAHALNSSHIKLTSFGLNRTIVINGQIAGTWKRKELKSNVIIETQLFDKNDKRNLNSIKTAAKKYAQFINKKILEKS